MGAAASLSPNPTYRARPARDQAWNGRGDAAERTRHGAVTLVTARIDLSHLSAGWTLCHVSASWCTAFSKARRAPWPPAAPVGCNSSYVASAAIHALFTASSAESLNSLSLPTVESN